MPIESKSQMALNDDFLSSPLPDLTFSFQVNRMGCSDTLSQDIDYFISRMDSNGHHIPCSNADVDSDCNDPLNYLPAREEKKRRMSVSIISFLEPIMNFSNDVELNSIQPNKKQRSMSPSSVVDICDDEIIKL